MSRIDENVFTDENSGTNQSNEDADSDNSSWNEGSEVKKKRHTSSRSKPKAHKSRRKTSRKKHHSKKRNMAESNSDADKIGKASYKDNLSKFKVKEESDLKDYMTDEVTSVMSDINPPSLATRSRIRRQFVRQARKVASSTSSALDSDGKKAKSEPILITLDSSDDENTSMLSSLPSRSARSRGEMMRKLKQKHAVKKSANKCSGSSSSSDSEIAKKKKRNKKKSKVLVSLEKIEEHPVLSEEKQKHTILKRVKNKHKSHIYTPIHKRRLKIRCIRQRFERQNIERRITPVRQVRMVTNDPAKPGEKPVSFRRTLRNSCNSHIDYKEEEETDSKLERRKRRVNSDPKNVREEIIESSSKRSIKNIDSAEVLKSRKSIDSVEENVKNVDGLAIKEKNMEETSNIDKKLEEFENKNELESNADTDLNDTEKSEEKKIIKSNSDTQDSKDDDNQNLKAEKKYAPKAVTHKITNPIGRPRKIVKSAGRKKKIKIQTPPNVIRRKGRPRKIDSQLVSKPVAETFNILNIKPQAPFLQNSFCFDVAPKLAKCRECRIAITRSSKRMYNSYCRFMEYRKLCYNKNGMISNAGFSNPSDANAEHLNLWLPQSKNPPKDLDLETAKSLLEHIGDQFCDLVEQEKEALNLHIGLQQVITWKRVVQGVREMCDVCYTTIFNIHWVCPICGLAVCIDCYKVRKQGEVVIFDDGEQPKDRDEYNWLLCLTSTNRIPHQQDSLVMAQIIPGTALWLMRDILHQVREKWNIPSYCKCNPPQMSASDNLVSTGINKQLMSCVTKNFSTEKVQSLVSEKSVFKPDTTYDDLDVEVTGSALRWLDNSNMISESAHSNLRMSDDYFNNFEDLVLIRGAGLLDDLSQDTAESDNELANFTLDDIIASVTNVYNKDSKGSSEKYSIKHFSQRYPQPKSGRDPLPIRLYTKIESEVAFPSAPHSWFCNGRLLFLHQANHKDNLALFKEQWKRGQPILVKSVDDYLDMNLWHPDSFSRDFGEVRNDLVDCKTGNILKNLPMKKFWEGFENFGKRLTDESGEFMLLKLKDWPPGEDFREKLPTRFDDLMNGLPLPEYTHRDGILNLAGRLPPSFVRPDLGPKMYNAYGSALYPTKGTTNLHLDVSDAVNVMVYVGIPADGNAHVHIQEALRAIDEGGCDSLMRARVRGRGCKPGALWHIYNARDADKIRDMLNKIAIERGEKMEANTDPIHDQSWYIDAELRMRLYRDYGVEGYAIAQCLGDAVFIPAGAPHQVRNLHSCVKVAEDFVSPENIAHCFKLTQEFRHLSDTHSNHEDKLQIKNIIYHVVKDSLSHSVSECEIPS